MSGFLSTLSKVEVVLITLLGSQAVIVALFPAAPPFVEWTSRVFGVIGVAAGIIKVVLAANGQKAAAAKLK
jgi:hypothetical protein